MLLVFAACSPIVGKICDKYPNRRNHVMIAGLFLMILLIPLMAVTKSLPMMILVLLGFGAALSCLSTPPVCIFHIQFYFQVELF
jgi:MFS family permease